MVNPYPPTLKVALIQMCPKLLDPEANFATASTHITRAASSGASLAVLPEYHLTGWAPESPEFAAIASTAGAYVPKYQELAKALKINIVPGTIVQTAPSTSSATTAAKPSLLNIAPFISYTGELLGTYTKTNLWHPERPHLTSSIAAHKATSSPASPPPPPPPLTSSSTTGASCPPPASPHTVIKTPLGPVGLLVCWDLAFPEAFRALVRQGAKLIVIPTFWMATDCSAEGLRYNAGAEALFLRATLTARAFENTAAVVFVNAGGPRADGYCGLSQVAMPLVGPVDGSFDGPDEGMRIVDVDMEILEVAERNYKVRADLAREDWHYGYSHEEESE